MSVNNYTDLEIVIYSEIFYWEVKKMFFLKKQTKQKHLTSTFIPHP